MCMWGGGWCSQYFLCQVYTLVEIARDEKRMRVRRVHLSHLTHSRPVTISSHSSWKHVGKSYRVKGDESLHPVIEASVSTRSISSRTDFIWPMVSSWLSHDFQELHLSTLSCSSHTRVWMSTFALPRLIHISLKVLMSDLDKSVNPALQKLPKKLNWGSLQQCSSTKDFLFLIYIQKKCIFNFRIPNFFRECHQN